MAKLMRSKLPSMVGVNVRPVCPPPSFIGPVWTALTPMVAKASHNAGSASVANTDSPSRVMMDAG